jgi:hypothetical protein
MMYNDRTSMTKVFINSKCFTLSKKLKERSEAGTGSEMILHKPSQAKFLNGDEDLPEAQVNAPVY